MTALVQAKARKPQTRAIMVNRDLFCINSFDVFALTTIRSDHLMGRCVKVKLQPQIPQKGR